MLKEKLDLVMHTCVCEDDGEIPSHWMTKCTLVGKRANLNLNLSTYLFGIMKHLYLPTTVGEQVLDPFLTESDPISLTLQNH